MLIKTPSQKTALFSAVFFMLLIALQACKGLLEPVPVATSPDEKTVVSMQVREGIPYFKVDRNNQDILLLSSIQLLADSMSVLDNVKWGTITPSFTREAWQESPGSETFIQDVYNEMAVDILDATNNQKWIGIRFRCYNEGIAYRYELGAAAQSTWVETSNISIGNVQNHSRQSGGNEFRFLTTDGWNVQWHQAPMDSLRFKLTDEEALQVYLNSPLLFKEKEEGLWASSWNVFHINPTPIDAQASKLILNLLRN